VNDRFLDPAPGRRRPRRHLDLDLIGAIHGRDRARCLLRQLFLQHGLDNGEPDSHRDYLFLSKGHDVPALYGTFVEMGFLEASRLQNHLSVHDHIYWHPNKAIPGVEFHSGSLGHLPAVAAGVALDCRLRGERSRVVGGPGTITR